MTVLRNTTVGDNLTDAIGGTPGVGDTVLITEKAAHYINGLDISTNRINKMVVGSTFTGSIGAGGSSCTVDLSGAGDELVIDGGGGKHFFTPKTTLVLATVIDTHGGQFGLTGGTTTKLEQAMGDTWVQGGAVLTAVDAGGGTIRIDDSATAVTLGEFEDMVLDLRRGFTTLIMTGCSGAIDEIDRAVGTLTGKMGSLLYNCGAITTLNAGSKFTLDMRNVQQDVTITNAELWPSSRVLFPTGPFTVTFPASPTLIAGGPDWYVS